MKIKQSFALKYIRLKLYFISIFSKKATAKEAFRLFCTPLPVSFKKLPEIFSSAEPLQLILDEKKVQGYRWNHPRKDQILILHGFASASYKFNYYIEAFIKKDYEVVAFDAPGHGRSEGKIINAVIYSEMVKKVIDTYGPFNRFLSHSFGGIALALTLEQANHDESTRAVLIAPATETSTAIDSALDFFRLNDKIIRREIDRIVLEAGGKPTEWYSVSRALRQVKANVLWIHDEDDDITPVKDVWPVKEEHLPNVKFLITKELGHRKIYHDAEVKKRILEFL